jgi:hypothetical protein
MRYTKTTIQHSRLANGSHKVEFHAQWECYFLKYVINLSAKASQDPIPIRVVQQFSKLRIESALQNGVTFDFLPDSNGPPYYSISPTTTPQHRVVMDSSRVDQDSAFQPSMTSFGDQEESQSVVARLEMFIISINCKNVYLSLLRVEPLEMHLFMQCNFYDLRSTQLSRPNGGRVWRSERTMARRMTHQLQRLEGQATVKYKGVRWRPERKHPWVAEITLSKMKRIWIGNYDTQKEAARAYDVATITHGKKTTLNFEDSWKYFPVSTTQPHLSRGVNTQPSHQ